RFRSQAVSNVHPGCYLNLCKTWIRVLRRISKLWVPRWKISVVSVSRFLHHDSYRTNCPGTYTFLKNPRILGLRRQSPLSAFIPTEISTVGRRTRAYSKRHTYRQSTKHVFSAISHQPEINTAKLCLNA